MKSHIAALPAFALALAVAPLLLSGSPASAQSMTEQMRSTQYDPAYVMPPPHQLHAMAGAPLATSRISGRAAAPIESQAEMDAQCNVISSGDESLDPALAWHCAEIPPADVRPSEADAPAS